MPSEWWLFAFIPTIQVRTTTTESSWPEPGHDDTVVRIGGGSLQTETKQRETPDHLAQRRTTKLPDLPGLNGDGVRGPVLAGSVAAAIAAYSLVRFLSRYFTRRALTLFAVSSRCPMGTCARPYR
jgi:hypothetical protein